MKTFYINPSTNDLEFDGQNNFKMVDGDDEIVQAVRELISTNLGEWFLNPSHGFARFDILGQKYNRDRAIDALYNAILQDERVASVEDVVLEHDKAARKLSIEFKFTKTNGETVEGEVNV